HYEIIAEKPVPADTGMTGTGTEESGGKYQAPAEQEESGARVLALARIRLYTGRHHQIRVQMSHAGMSLLGDYKYADEQTKKLSDALQQRQAALCAYRLAFTHPVTGKRMSFQRSPAGSIFQNFLI
ncbi:MAG: hypothetical protein K2N98_06740, partial [Lachnospiraceae bacterium]|nr:hypothetical protein [Lachnospiraceae bacterium]